MKSCLLGAISACVFTFGIIAPANAALVSELGGQVVYDTDRDITWLADANLGASNDFGVTGIGSNGVMSWETAHEWIAAMNAANHLGFSNWRLPITLLPDASCDNASNSTGFNCTGSEMGHLYNVEGVTEFEPGLFSNVMSDYWSGTEFDASNVYGILMDNGFQMIFVKVGGGEFTGTDHVWAVRDGDVSTVPVPAAVWLFGSGLLGLIGIAKPRGSK